MTIYKDKFRASLTLLLPYLILIAPSGLALLTGNKWWLTPLGLLLLVAPLFLLFKDLHNPVLTITDGEVLLRSLPFSKLKPIGTIQEFHLVIQKNVFYFRKEGQQDYILPRTVDEKSWLSICRSVMSMPFNGFTIAYDKAIQGDT